MEDSLVVYVTGRKFGRRFRPGAKADRFLALALGIPGILFVVKSAWKLAVCWPATQWTDEGRIVPAATASLGCLLIGLGLAIWIRRESHSATWLVEQPAYVAEQLENPQQEKTETPAA